MNSQDALISHIISQTITSLSFLQSQGIIGSSTELDQVRNQLIAKQHGGGLVAGMTGMSIGTVPGPSQQSTFGHSSGSMASPSPQPQPEAGPVSMTHSSSMPSLPPRRAPSISTQPEQRDRAVALWNYDSQAHGDLAFKKDDVIIVDEEVNPEWYRGHLEADPSRHGLFPHNYIQRLQPSNTMPRTDSHASHHSQYSTQHSLPPSQPIYAGQQAQTGTMMPYQPLPPPTVYQQQPLPPPTHSYAVASTPGSVVQVEESGKKSRFKLKPDGKATHFAHSAVGGLGFGAGVGVASSLVNNILN